MVGVEIQLDPYEQTARLVGTAARLSFIWHELGDVVDLSKVSGFMGAFRVRGPLPPVAPTADRPKGA